MKKIFTIMLTFLFLLSGIGFGSSLHYCQTSNQTMLPGEMDCCSKESAPKQQAKKDSCCQVEDSGSPALTTAKGFAGGCCVLQQTYTQVDISPKPHSQDLGQLSAPSHECEPKLKHLKSTDLPALIVPLEPSSHHSLPLLS